MSSQLGPLDIQCDAPPYSVVHACEGLGFRSPLDVRWCRMSHFPGDREGGTGMFPWKLLFGAGQPQEKACTCGVPLPALEKYTFTLVSAKVSDYFLGQCRRCHTVFWEER
jgi:hypothetical protein